MAQQNQEKQDNQKEPLGLFSYDPFVVVRDLLKHWYLVLAVAILAGMATFVYEEQSYQPIYTTNATLVVNARGNSTTVYQNLQSASDLAGVFSEVLNSSLLRNAIREELELPEFSGTITTAPVSGTNLITVQVSDKDPRTAFLIMRALIEKHSLVSYKVMGSVILEVLQAPRVPVAPSNPLNARAQTRQAIRIAAAVMCVLLLLRSALRDTVRSREEADQKLAVRILAELPHERKIRDLRMAIRLRGQKTSVLIAKPSTSFSYVEKIRRLRRQVEQHMPEGGKTLLVTSVLENEGKSTVAANLALSLAQKNRRVLLIDADMRRPACGKVLERKASGAGVADVLQGKAKMEEAMFPYNKNSSLTLLLQERGCGGSVDLIGSERMAALLQQAAEQFDYVIIDSPPMSVGPDAESLAELVDASMLVVRQNTATAWMLNHALDILTDAQSKPIGCVLNNVFAPVLPRMSSYGYGYGYGGRYSNYGYGHYGRYGAARHKQTTDDEGVQYDK